MDKPLLRTLTEYDDYKTLYLKPKEGQFDNDFLDEGPVLVSGVITVTSVFLGGKDPSLLIRVDEMTITKTTPIKPKKPVVIDDSDDE